MAEVRNAITDDTDFEGLTTQTVRMWEAMVQAAGTAGLAVIELQAGAGGGHRSHNHGTEVDLIGYNADGTTWTADQRLAVAYAAAAAGGRRFGFYTRSDRPVSVLHAGIGYEGVPTNVAWGPGGRVSGVGVNQFLPQERAFVEALRAGNVEAFIQTPEVMAFSPTVPTVPDGEALGAIARITSNVPSMVQIVGNGGMIREGARGDAVREMQEFLNNYGFTDAAGNPLNADGVFGRKTAQAVRAFQSEAGLTADGVIGPATMQQVSNRLADVENPPQMNVVPNEVRGGFTAEDLAPIAESGILRRGTSGDEVKRLQEFLNANGFVDVDGRQLEADGVYGARTQQAVRVLQRDHGLTVDGIVGPETQAALMGMATPSVEEMAADGSRYMVDLANPEIAPMDFEGARAVALSTQPVTGGDGMLPAGDVQTAWRYFNNDQAMVAHFRDLPWSEFRDFPMMRLSPEQIRLYGTELEHRRQQFEVNVIATPGAGAEYERQRAADEAAGADEFRLNNRVFGNQGNPYNGMTWADFRQIEPATLETPEQMQYYQEQLQRFREEAERNLELLGEGASP